MLQAIFRLLILVVLVRLLMSVVRALRPPRSRRFSRKPEGERVKSPDYSDLTPYDIEDADYEDLPKGKD